MQKIACAIVFVTCAAYIGFAEVHKIDWSGWWAVCAFLAFFEII